MSIGGVSVSGVSVSGVSVSRVSVSNSKNIGVRVIAGKSREIVGRSQENCGRIFPRKGNLERHVLTSCKGKR